MTKVIKLMRNGTNDIFATSKSLHNHFSVTTRVHYLIVFQYSCCRRYRMDNKKETFQKQDLNVSYIKFGTYSCNEIF